jgi:hypothetical protein
MPNLRYGRENLVSINLTDCTLRYNKYSLIAKSNLCRDYFLENPEAKEITLALTSEAFTLFLDTTETLAFNWEGIITFLETADYLEISQNHRSILLWLLDEVVKPHGFTGSCTRNDCKTYLDFLKKNETRNIDKAQR